MKRAWLAALAVVGLLLSGAGCGHSRGHDWYVTTSHHDQPFTLTLVNHTSVALVPGPIHAEPYDPYIPTVVIPQDGTASYSIGFLPTSITVGATGTGPWVGYVYPSQTLYLGVDYFSDASGVTFVFH